jgi:large subunit ribosomal protein L17
VALFRNLMTELFRHERIRTTKAKAKAVRSHAEKMITMAKRANVKRNADGSDVWERRQAAAALNDPVVVKRLFDEIAPRFAERPGGYTRVLKLGPRQGDAAEMVILELVE